MLPERTPHPVADLATAMENRRRICDRRGYCGPFLNAAFYAAYPDPLWCGMAECVHCRSTVSVEHERGKEREALAAAPRAPASADLPPAGRAP